MHHKLHVAVIAGALIVSAVSGCAQAPMGSSFTTGAMTPGTMPSSAGTTAATSNSTTQDSANR